MTAPKIEKLLTPYNFTNANNVGRIKYIVIHYVGALGGAWANCHYYASKYLGASAHYFVGFEGEIWQSVEDEDIAWHCGAKSYKHAECRNSNSIGIELCVHNKGSQADTSKDWYFEDATVASAIELTQYLMKKYNVPADHVIRHYDVTGKICPNPYVYNTTKHVWDAFKKAIATDGAGTEDTGYRVEHEQNIRIKQRYRARSVSNRYEISRENVAYRLTIDFFEYLKLNGLWNLTGSRVMDSQRVEYPTKQSYKTAVHNKENLTVTWHEEHNLFFLDGTWSLDGSKIIDAYQKTEVM